jgi:hypothetical protein
MRTAIGVPIRSSHNSLTAHFSCCAAVVTPRRRSVLSLLLANREDLICDKCLYVSASWTLDVQADWDPPFLGCSHGFEMYTTFAFP